MMTKKFYNIEGIIRNGFKLSRNYDTLDFNFTKLGDAGVAALAKSKSVRRLKPQRLLRSRKIYPIWSTSSCIEIKLAMRGLGFFQIQETWPN
jgi:hypothetical protein